MKFYGNGVVWDKSNNRPLCRFTNGVYETYDDRQIELLKPLYKHDREVIEISKEDYTEILPFEEIPVEKPVEIPVEKSVEPKAPIKNKKGVKK